MPWSGRLRTKLGLVAHCVAMPSSAYGDCGRWALHSPVDGSMAMEELAADLTALAEQTMELRALAVELLDRARELGEVIVRLSERIDDGGLGAHDLPDLTSQIV